MAQPSVSLGTYQLYVTRNGEQLPLHDLGGVSFLSWVEQEMTKKGLRGRDNGGLHRHQHDTMKKDGTHTIYGRLRSGDIGFGSRFVNDDTETLEYSRSTKAAELIPFYFQLYAPHGSTLAVLVLQKLGNRGPYTFFREELKRAFISRFGSLGLSLHIGPYIAKDVLDRLANGVVTQVKFRKYTAPQELASFVSKNGLVAKDLYFETRLIAKEGTSLNLGRYWKQLVRGLTKREKVEVPSEWAEFGDEIRVTVRSNNSTRTLSFGEGREPVPYEDVSQRVTRDKDAHPTIASIHPVANELVLGIREELKIIHA